MGKKDENKKKNLGSAKAAAEAAGKKAEDVLDAVKDKAEDIADAVKDKAEDIADAVKDKAEDIADAVKDKAEDIADAAEDAAEDIADTAEDVADAAEEKAEDTAKKAKKKHQRTPEAERERALNKVKRRKKFKYGTLATVITVVFLAAVVMVNIIVRMLDKRYNWSIDLTSKGMYQIDEQTADYLHQLNDDIKLTMLADEAQFDDYKELKVLAETLKRFENESNGRITVEYVDPTTHPEVETLYLKDTNETVARWSLIVTCGDLVRVIPYTDLISQESQYDYTTGMQNTENNFVGEQALISAIIGVTDLHPVKVGVICNNNGNPMYDSTMQYCFARLEELLTKNNFSTTQIDIATEALSADYDLMILCAPQSDLTEAQVKKLSDYLNNDGKCGKNLIYFSTLTRMTEMKNLNNFLAEWGMVIDNAIVMESDENRGQTVNTSIRQLPLTGVPIVAANPDAPLNANYKGGSVPIVAPYHAPIRTLFEDSAGRNTYPLLVTSDTAVIFPLDAAADNFDVKKAEKSVVNLAVQAEHNYIAGGETFKSRVIAFGSPLFVDYFIGGNATSYDNSNYFITMMNTLSGKDNVITVASKSLDPTKITITEAQAKTIRNVIVYIIPAAVALIGILVYVRRRNR